MTRANTPEDFWRYIEKTETCWLCRQVNTQGYGIFHMRRKRHSAHRFAYELLVGPIPDGLVIDHLCRVRNCVNPAHLEAVTAAENTLRSPVVPAALNKRKTQCTNGHKLSTENAWPSVAKRGVRSCRRCDEEKRSVPTPCTECGKTLRADSIRRHIKTMHANILAGVDEERAA